MAEHRQWLWWPVQSAQKFSAVRGVISDLCTAASLGGSLQVHVNANQCRELPTARRRPIDLSSIVILPIDRPAMVMSK